MDNDYNLKDKKEKLEKDKTVPNKSYARRVYTVDEIQEILKDYIEVNRSKFPAIKAGNNRVCYLRADDNSFCRGGFVNVNPIEKKDGSEIYFQLRGNVRKSAKGNVMWLIPYSGISRLWLFLGPEMEYARREIKKSEKKQREELSQIVEKVSVHLRNMKREIRSLKQEIKELKNENASVLTEQTNFSALKVYDDTGESDIE